MYIRKWCYFQDNDQINQYIWWANLDFLPQRLLRDINFITPWNVTSHYILFIPFLSARGNPIVWGTFSWLSKISIAQLLDWARGQFVPYTLILACTLTQSQGAVRQFLVIRIICHTIGEGERFILNYLKLSENQ